MKKALSSADEKAAGRKAPCITSAGMIKRVARRLSAVDIDMLIVKSLVSTGP
jgi:hypothetical protein